VCTVEAAIMHEGESFGSENTIALPNEKGEVAGALGPSEHLESITTVVESLSSINSRPPADYSVR
jgi:hypothetical protein